MAQLFFYLTVILVASINVDDGRPLGLENTLEQSSVSFVLDTPDDPVGSDSNDNSDIHGLAPNYFDHKSQARTVAICSIEHPIKTVSNNIQHIRAPPPLVS